MKWIKSLFVVFAMLSLSSCASYIKRQECEKTNWHEYGQSVAMRGKRPDADTFVQECKKVEAKVDWAGLDSGFKSGMAKYCKLGTAYNKGRNGETYNFDFCDYNQVAALKSKFEKGRKDLCTKDGYKFGSTGKVYSNQCSDDLEPEFLKKYKRGRRKFLSASIQSNHREISNINSQILQEQNNLIMLQSQLNSLNSSRRGQYVTERVYDNKTRTYRTVSKWQEDPGLSSQKSNLNYKINNSRRKITQLQERQNSLREKNIQLQQELNTME